MKQKWLLSFFIMILLASLACSLSGGGGDDEAGAEGNPPAAEEVPAADSEASSEFPLPPKYNDLQEVGQGVTMFQTSMKLDEVVEFYRDAFAKSGYKEREINTVINDTTFSIVWDGHASGKVIVVQGVDLGNGMVNVSIRLEDL